MARKILGYIILSLLFGGVLFLCILSIGWEVTTLIFGGVGTMLGLLFAGVWLIDSR